MRPSLVLAFSGCLVVASSHAGRGWAQGSPTEARDLLRTPEALILVRASQARRGAKLRFEVSPRTPASPGAAATEGALEVSFPAPVSFVVASRGERVAALAWTLRGEPFAEVILVDVAEAARPRLVQRTRVWSSGDSGRAPIAGVITSTPDGFAFLLQAQTMEEAQRTDVRSELGRLDPEARLLGLEVVPVPWAIAAMAWNGAGYTLALYYGAGASETPQARLCIVTLSTAGAPREHPWWASPTEDIAEAKLFSTERGLQIVWRGGPDGRQLRAAPVGPGSWGREPAPPASLGEIPPERAFTVEIVDGRPVSILR